MGQLPSVINVDNGRSPDLNNQEFDKETMDQMNSQMMGLDNNYQYDDDFRRYQDDETQLTLEDFDSAALKINRVPKTASQTCQGQVLIRPVVKPIPYSGYSAALHPTTIEQFKMSKKEQEISAGTKIHKFNHISQNIKLAANIREYYNTQHSFKRSVLSKNNKQNL